MSEPLVIILGGVTLPEQTQLLETTTPREVDVETANGSLYTDYTTKGFRRSWTVALLPLCRDDFEAIYNAYRSQYINETYLPLVCPARGINTMVKANISDQDIKWNGDRIDGFALALKEAYAVS